MGCLKFRRTSASRGGVRRVVLLAVPAWCVVGTIPPSDASLAVGATGAGHVQPEVKPAVRQPDPALIARYAKIAEDLQRIDGRDPTQPNGMVALRESITKFRAAIASVVKEPKDRAADEPHDDFSLVFYDDWREEPDRAEMERNLAASLIILDRLEENGFWDDLARAVAMPRIIRPMPVPGEALGEGEEVWSGRFIDVMLPELGRFRNITRASNARMELALKSGNEARFLETFDTTMRLAEVCTRFPTLIDRLVGIAIGALTLERARDYCASGKATAAGLESIERSLSHIDPLPSIRPVLEGERVFVIDTADWTFGAGDKLDSTEFRRLASDSDAPIGDVRKADTLAMMNRYFDTIQTRAEMPTYRRLAEPIPEEVDVKKAVEGNPFLQVLLPAFPRIFLSQDQFRLEVNGLRTMIALEQFRLAKGVYPKSLSELPALRRQGQDAAGTKPWEHDPFSGKALGYRLLDKAPADPKTAGRTARYVLYSLGIDGEDNGGTEVKDRYTSLRKKTGGDFVVSWKQ